MSYIAPCSAKTICTSVILSLIHYNYTLDSIIVDKIDKDGDGRATEDELKNWVKEISRRYVSKLIVCVCMHLHIYLPQYVNL